MGNEASVAVTTGAAVGAERAAQDAAPVLAAACPVDAVTAVLRARGLRAGEVTMEAVEMARQALYLPETVKVLGVVCVRYDDPHRGPSWRARVAQTTVRVTFTANAKHSPWVVYVYSGSDDDESAQTEVAHGVGSTPADAERWAERDFRRRGIASCRASADIGIGVEQ